MKNKESILIGIVLSLLFIFVATGLSSIILIDEAKNIYLNSLLLLAPIIAVVFVIEISFVILGKSKLGLLRYSTIVFLLFISGYLIINIFYGLFRLALFPARNSIWLSLSKLWQLEGNQTYVLLGFILVVTLSYLQIVQKRLMQYISVKEKQ